MASSEHEATSLDNIEREKTLHKDAELQVENATVSRQVPIDEGEVRITPKTWWVIFVSAGFILTLTATADFVRFSLRRSVYPSGQYQRHQQ